MSLRNYSLTLICLYANDSWLPDHHFSYVYSWSQYTLCATYCTATNSASEVLRRISFTFSAAHRMSKAVCFGVVLFSWILISQTAQRLHIKCIPEVRPWLNDHSDISAIPVLILWSGRDKSEIWPQFHLHISADLVSKWSKMSEIWNNSFTHRWLASPNLVQFGSRPTKWAWVGNAPSPKKIGPEKFVQSLITQLRITRFC